METINILTFLAILLLMAGGIYIRNLEKKELSEKNKR